MDHSQYSTQRRILLVKFGSLGIKGVSRAFPLLKETTDPVADAARYVEQLEAMRDSLHNSRAARGGR